jgi:hypothetical protein
MKAKSRAEEMAEAAYRQHYARMIGVGSLKSHAEISTDFYLEGMKAMLEEARKLSKKDSDLALIERLEQLMGIEASK